jgi:ABC-type nitrate/sulfonate/bicarbonate transport system, ATPase component
MTSLQTATGGSDVIVLDNFGVSLGSTQILESISLNITEGEFVCLVGASGCGKSTLLRTFGGLIEGDGGIDILGQSPAASYEKVAYVFQNARLLRWRTALDNVILGRQLRFGRASKAELREKAAPYLELVGLRDVAARTAHVMSGGEQQRVAIARALAVEPTLLLMDEPFSALDVKTRRALREEIVRIWQRTGVTIVFVTHSIEEALLLGSRVVVLKGKPSTVVADIDVGMPYPRELLTEEFKRHRDELTELLDGGELN